MASIIVLRLHPVEPVAGEDFTSYLTGLSITAWDLTFSTPLDGILVGTATYKPPPDTSTTIVQHYSPPGGGLPPVPAEPLAVATAVIKVPDPPDHPEHGTRDLRLEITRAGKQIVHRQVYFNVPEQQHDGPLPLAAYPLLGPSLFLPLPAAALDSQNPLELPADGTPPRFADLRRAVTDVLGHDPGDTDALPTLTPQQARHVAYEIVWNNALRPLPVPDPYNPAVPNQSTRSLEAMYTGKKGDDDPSEQARRRFEGERQAYYAKGNAEAERLAGFVFALSGAVAAEARSRQADRAGLDFPVQLTAPPTGTGARYREAKVILNGLGALPEPRFGVPAAYFYVLSATMPTSVAADRRYELAVLADEKHTRDTLRTAITLGVLEEAADQDGVGFEPPLATTHTNINQAARRLRALGAATGPATPLTADHVRTLLESHLAFKGEDIAAFWGGLTSAADLAAHLELVLRALTGGHDTLVERIRTSFAVGSAAELAQKKAEDWRALFRTPDGGIDDTLLPPFIIAGSPQDRVNAFIRHVAKFFALTTETGDREAPEPELPPRFRELHRDPLTAFTGFYGPDFTFGEPWDEDRMHGAVTDVFPDDHDARAWLEQLIRAVDELTLLAQAIPAGDRRFSAMEALYARGFTSRAQVRELSLEEFTRALTGTVVHQDAPLLHAAATAVAEGGDGAGDDEPGCFVPVNPGGRLVDCRPPDHLSPLGPMAYLQQLLRLSTRSTCEDPTPSGDFSDVGDLLAARRGPAGELLASEANLSTPLPVIDLVNECLEAVATHPGDPVGAVYNTSGTELGGHTLGSPHDPPTLFAALPEHSTPATPVAEPGAYEILRKDFSAPALPYAQALDINRGYLRHLRTSRYATMRRFRADITELVLDPAAEPAGFQRHLWRYPVRAELAHEYLGITPEEAELLYGTGELPLWELYGFPAETVGDRPWTRIVVRLPEFLARTGLSYCAFLELWRSAYVRFCAYLPSDARDTNGDASGVRDDAAVRDDVDDCLPFPDCEPCHLTDYRIRFTDPQDPEQALRRLAVFIRLWRTLRALPGGGYRFAELRDICEVLGLFGAEGTVAPGFLRQLAAFQLLRDDFRIALTDGSPPAPGETGERRTHLLALWVGPDATHWDWAVDELLDQVQWHARARHGCGCRPPEFRKLLAENLGPLSRLAGFDPGSAADTWSARPTHTLRFAEVLGKIYASDFGIGEILFLFTTDDHLDGDDPFPLQPGNEALDSPLGLPDDETRFSLWDLRRALLAVEVSDEDAAAWSWDRISTTLRGEFGFTPPSGSPDPLLSLGTHFFPSVLETCGLPVPIADRQYRTGLPSADTAPLMWNTPPDGPFRYDTAAEQLWTQLPLTDEAVIAKLGRVRQLKPAEQTAVRELYFLPRADLAPFAFLFGNLADAEERLLQEPDEGHRWAYFQRSFARTHARCRIIAEHLAGHVAEWIGRPGDNGGDDCGAADLAWTLLGHLYADENRALGPWESDSGERPAVTWPDQPTGGAFAALLGLTGTGLLGELAPEGGPTVWRELRGPMSAFGPEVDAAGVQLPTVLPGLDVTLSEAQKRFVSVRNGLALANPDGRPLGSAQGWTARWSGALLIDEEGGYTFRAGAPAPVGQPPDAAAAHRKRWRVSLRRGQRSWVLLSHDWPDETAPPDCSAPLTLRRGVYQLVVELAQPRPEFARPEDVCPATGGFEVAYAGPDSGGELVTLPYERLFHDRKDGPLDEGLCVRGAARSFLRGRFTSTLRDIRRTYQRAFKALLFTSRFELSARPAADDGQSELGYLLAHAEDFTGTSYYRHGGGFRVHRAFLDVNFLPLKDNYRPPAPAQDRRMNPSPRRRQALFDWWERIFDYTVVRRDAVTAPERPLWLLFHEAAENHPDDPAHLLRHMGVDLLHTPLVLRYFPGHQVSSADLEDERWAIRVWHADTWIRALRRHFLVKDLQSARPDLWASDDPGALPAGETVTGNQNLTRFVREGCFENGQPRRYEDVKRLNDGLRERARAALHAYLCAMDRVPLPDGASVSEPGQLSEVLLLDVEAGLCERTTRIEEAIGAVQLFIRRAQLGLEPRFTVTPAFSLLWERRFADYRRWETCTRRELYRENWIDWEELEEARRGEGFRLLEAELRGATLTVPLPGGLEHWSGGRPPVHPGLTPLQADRPAGIQGLDPAREGLDLLGTPEWSATPSWLAAVGLSAGDGGGSGNGDNEGGQDGDGPRLTARGESGGADADISLWIQAAVRLGTRFIRVAAACEPPAAMGFAPRPADGAEICCADCGAPPSAVVDEYYFWTVDVRHYEEQEQQAEWPWHQPGELPRLLHWDSGRAVRLAWCRVHNGRFLQPRRSAEAVRIGDGDDSGDLEFVGRTADSLTFRVTGGIAPPPHLGATAGFRYDLPTDAAVPLPLVVEPATGDTPRYPGALPAYPYFAYHAPGTPLVPASPFAPAVTVAGTLRARCRFEAALKWYELAFAPLSSDSDWLYGAGDDARQRSIVLHYTETLLQWGDAALQRGTPEAFGHARLLFDTAARLLGARPRTIRAEAGREPDTVADFVPLAPPLNPRLVALYDRTADRQGLIRACLDAHRLRRPALPYPGAWPDAGRASARPCPDDADWCAPPSPYRFVFLVQKAVELTGEVRTLGTALLTAYEKGDAEYLASLRATQESQLLALASQVRQQQWREADWQLQALRKTKEMTQTRRNYYAALVEHGLISKEIEYENLTGTGLALRTASNVTEGIAQIMGLIPDMFVGFPCNQIQPPVGSKLGGVFSAAARITNGLAEIANTTAGLRLTQAGWERREEEWRHQVEVLDIELEQVERQILAAERRRGIALRELESHQRQLEHSVDVQDFLRSKFTSHDLYLYLQQETAALYDQLYELAVHATRQAQRAFNIERGHTVRDFLPVEDGYDLRERLLAGERLQLALRQMEHSYLDENLREYELTKHFSLRRDFPLQFLLLQATGECEFELAEWMFDQDYGHYLRRIRNVGLTIPCVVGPYAGVHCRLTLLSSSTRISPELTVPPAGCCGEEGPDNGYPALPDDPRVVNEYLATEAIATSTGQNDTGMFELNFRDERKLPFEFRGAVSRWRIEMRPRNNQFDLDTVADVLLHLNYTAREGGDALRHAAEEITDRHLPGSGLRYFDVRHDMTSAWHAFQRPHGEDRHHELTLRLGRGMFPFLPGGPDVRVSRLELFFETADAVPSEHRLLRFTPARPHGHHSDDRCPATEVRCVAGADWPGLFHGVLQDPGFGPLVRTGEGDLGTFSFPALLPEVTRILLLCAYEVC